MRDLYLGGAGQEGGQHWPDAVAQVLPAAPTRRWHARVPHPSHPASRRSLAPQAALAVALALLAAYHTLSHDTDKQKDRVKERQRNRKTNRQTVKEANKWGIL